MIKSLNIFNFQSHEKSFLEFDSGVNVIVGASDSGKTAIIRALRWVIWNRPSGDSICSYWGGETSVAVETEDAVKITRSKGKVDKYISHVTGEEDLEFKAFGTSVPEEITQFLNINEINLQSQLDSPFLLSETPGKVAEHWNNVAHLEKIDLATSNINSAIRELTSDIKYSEGQEKTLQEDLEKFEHLEKFEIEVEVLEELEKQFKQLCTSKDKLEDIISIHQINGETILEYKELLELEKPLDQIFKWKDEIEDIGTTGSELQFLVKQIKEVQSSLINQNAVLLVEKPVNDLLKLYKEKELAVNEQKGLFKALESIKGVQVRLKTAKANYDTLEKEFEKMMPVGSICPLCGAKIN